MTKEASDAPVRGLRCNALQSPINAVYPRLRWYAWNAAHIARHQVTPTEVIELCQGNHLERAAYAARIMPIGPTQAGRMLSVVLDPEGDDVYYVVTARPASRRERRVYGSQKR